VSSAIGICALCLERRPIRESHLIPEFCYQGYDHKHRLLVVGDTDDKRKNPKIQKGIRCELLCDGCEGALSRLYEDPFKRYWFDTAPLPKRMRGLELTLKVPDPATFKLFHLSILWRSYASRNKIRNWQGVDLGPHGERIRTMIRANEPGPEWLYPVGCAAMVNSLGEPEWSVIKEPHTALRNGRHYHCFIFGGCMWMYLTAKHDARVMPESFLRDNGDLRVYSRPLASIAQVSHAMAVDLAFRGERPKP
jgi:hypothetical protein